MKNLFLFVVSAVFCCTTTYAQTTSTNAQASNSNEINWENFELELENLDTEWTFHTDQQSKVLYIDFEALGGKMSKLVLTNNNEEIVVMDDHLFDLPANTIYEVDLAKLTTGDYSLELHTYNSIIKETINIQ